MKKHAGGSEQKPQPRRPVQRPLAKQMAKVQGSMATAFAKALINN